MMSLSKEGKVTAAQVLAPVSLIALVLFLSTLSETVQTFQVRDALRHAKEQQVKPMEDVQKVQTQLDALALGTKRLAAQGDKSAQAIIDSLKQAGITVNADTSAATAPAQPAQQMTTPPAMPEPTTTP